MEETVQKEHFYHASSGLNRSRSLRMTQSIFGSQLINVFSSFMGLALGVSFTELDIREIFDRIFCTVFYIEFLAPSFSVC